MIRSSLTVIRLSVHVLAAVDVDRRPGYERSVLGNEELHASGNVLCTAQPADRNRADYLLKHFLGNSSYHVRVNIARRNRIGGNAVPRAFLGQGLGKSVNTGFCS